MTDPDLPTRTEGEGETLDMPEGLGTFSKGQILGEPTPPLDRRLDASGDARFGESFARWLRSRFSSPFMIE